MIRYKLLRLLRVYALAMTATVYLCSYSFAQEGAQYNVDSGGAESGVKIEQERISLDLKGIDIMELLRTLAIKMNVTIVPTRNVTGRVNIFLNNLTFDDALDVVLISQDLACDKDRGIINVMTATEYQALYGEKYNEKRKVKNIKLTYAKPANVFSAISQLKSDIGKIITDETTGTILLIDIPEKLKLMEETIKGLDQPLETEVFDLKYAKSTDMKAHLASIITTGPGELYVDERSGKVIISDLPDKMTKIKQVVRAFDEASRQVFIEAEILQITLKDEFQRGINWEKYFSEKDDNLNYKGTFPVSTSFTPSPLLAGSNLQMTLGTFLKDNYTVVIQALKTFGDAKILSRPRIAAVNNQEAKIMVGSREAYITQSQSQATSTTVTSESIEFVDVGIKLNVVPTINKDGFVTMKIKPEVSSVRETLTSSLGSKVPILETSEAETVVKVKDGTTIMIAGLMKEEKRKDVTGIPIISKIPILGIFFGSRATQTKKTELIVFITPHIISGDIPIKNAEAEKLIPPEIMPEDMEREMIFKRVEEIKMKSQGSSGAEIQKSSVLNMQEKMKGIKKDD